MTEKNILLRILTDVNGLRAIGTEGAEATAALDRLTREAGKT